jgi:hypothetical protein
VTTTKTTVLDLTTMGHALNELSSVYGGITKWQGATSQQEEFLVWYLEHSEAIAKLGGLKALAAMDHEVLNKFLTDNGFDPMFEPITGVGVASILDMLVEWAVQASKTEFTVYDFENYTHTDYSAFEIPGGGVEFFHVEGRQHPLACLHTKTGGKLWLIKSNAPASGLDLALDAQYAILAASRRRCYDYQGVVVPTIEIDTKPDLNWMRSFSWWDRDGGGHALSQAFQQFKLRISEKGARVKAATGFATRGAPAGPVNYTFDSPFIGFFTQPGHDALALAAFYADVDAWKEPQGSLEEL